jgi:hypothetical protein
LRRAADFDQSLAINPHIRIVFEPRPNFPEDASGVGIGRLDYFVMHPFAVSPGLYYTGAAQIRQVTRNLRLVRPQHLHEEAYTDLAITHQV